VNRHTLQASGKHLVTLVQTEQLPFLAAAIAYYAFVSIVPLLIVGLAVTTAVAGETLGQEVVAVVGGFLTPEASSLLEDALAAEAGRGGVTVAGMVVLAWSGLRVFRGLDVAFSRIYGAEAPKPLLGQVRDGLLVLAVIGLAIVGTTAVAATLPLAGGPLSGMAGTVGLFVLLPVVLFPLYYVFPSRHVALSEAIPGAVFAGGGWTLLGTAFGVYTTYAGSFQLYGVLGGVLLLLVWFYSAGLVLLLGAALNVVVADGFRDRQLQQGSLRETDQRATMSEADGPTDERPDNGGSVGDDRSNGDRSDRGSEDGASPDENGGGPDRDPTRRADVATLDDLDDLRQEIEAFEEEIEGRTVHRDDLEGDLKQYVRGRVRRGHATGWGPYLVLLYGTVMTLGAFFFLSGPWALLAMLVVWLSTLGLYALMVLVGIATTTVGLPGRLLDRLRNLR
jgi:membrane protein